MRSTRVGNKRPGVARPSALPQSERDMTMRRRLTRLEALLPPPPSPDLLIRMQRCGPIFDRWHDLGAAASQLMCPEEEDRVLSAVQQLHETWLGPYGVWFWCLCEGHCRLPELTPQVMKDLLEGSLCQSGNVEGGPAVTEVL
jgi:hypothetical protein